MVDEDFEKLYKDQQEKLKDEKTVKTVNITREQALWLGKYGVNFSVLVRRLLTEDRIKKEVERIRKEKNN